MGYSNTAHVDMSLAWGYSSHSYGTYSASFGNSLNSNSHNMFTIGAYNDVSVFPGANASSWVATDPLFVIGNGTGVLARSNAMIVLKNGRVGIGGKPTHDLEVVHGSFGGVNASDGFTIRNSGANDVNWTLYSYNGTGNLGLFEGSTLRGQFATGTGTYTAVSDGLQKESVKAMPAILPLLLQLAPKEYHYKTDQAKKNVYGLIAQEVMKLFPQFVYTSGEDSKSYSMDYSGMSVLAIKAIQEQQQIISIQQQKIDELEKRLQAIENRLK